MENKLQFHKVDNDKELIEINKINIEEKEYVLLLQNQSPYCFQIGKINENNMIELLTNRALATKILLNILKDEKTQENLKFISEQLQ